MLVQDYALLAVPGHLQCPPWWFVVGGVILVVAWAVIRGRGKNR